MHEVHCRRNIVLCGKCSEPVPRGEIESHDEEFHGEEPCEMCQVMIEKCKMDDHKVFDIWLPYIHTIVYLKSMHLSYMHMAPPFHDDTGLDATGG